MNVMNAAGNSAYDAPQPLTSRPDIPMLGLPRDYKIRRMGARPLLFRGAELAMCMSFTPELPYWYEMNIYRTEQQTFVLAIRLFFQSDSERDRVRAWEFDTLPSLFSQIETYDAAQDVRFDLTGDIGRMSAAELAAQSLDLAARVAAARLHFAGLAGELFAEMDAAA
ncbi:hypothetical protein [Cereibacter sphaeroides]|uniref:Uncharacterized protein n=1 Tax=Cereibacter sphaeroides TaxID=1063 RepID=O54074_CERSP|nr:hypothetical protein [Cereibacter sphaeroides]GEM94209.1 hypothetical protein RSP03_32760 [Cereibacter sphaeroides]CAA05379.1 hypothetical protein [Cereibacter sphaeroides]